ncbi:hypothetical protein JRO89_XSUnG0068600 [Xanthoceras sorbifolium]|uniref:Expansin-like EG45 domain-containing protein n=1 Tax=Xanthoceras sorbifolium TaxID=99658 RepID=A0ABQ8GZN7_9ROSI|nr:hypothetical protein JRO89_XSUnG0068600 [Xanthoceras sorbifolium]
MQRLFIVTALIFCLFSMAVVAKTATFYSPPYTPSECNDNQDMGVMIAAASDEFWEGGKACGKKYKVKCLGPKDDGDRHPCKGKGEVEVTIIDHCRGDCRGYIDLSEDAFRKIAILSAGVIKVSLDEYATPFCHLWSTVRGSKGLWLLIPDLDLICKGWTLQGDSGLVLEEDTGKAVTEDGVSA